jgi:hypothetical protein
LTTDKDFKRLIRARSRKTGESYSVARRRLLAKNEGVESSLPPLLRVERPEHGFAVYVPEHWQELPLEPADAPYEVARFGYKDPKGHLCMVFRDEGPLGHISDIAARARTALEVRGFSHFVLSDVEMAGREAVRLDFESVQKEGLWRVSDYLVKADNLVYILGVGTSEPDKDAPVFDEMLRRFELTGG